MPTIRITDKLRDTIIDSRKQYKINGSELSEKIKKGKAYISQIENGKIKSIDPEVLINLFRYIYYDKPEESFQLLIQEVLDGATTSLSKKEIEHEEWLIIFNYHIRLFPVEQSLIDFIRNKLSELNLTPEELISIVNKNEGLPNPEDYKVKNKLYITINPTINGFTAEQSIKFDLPLDFLTKILNKEVVKCNYIQMQGIIWNLFHIECTDSETAHKETQKVLYSNGFMTLDERQEYMNKIASQKESDNQEFTIYDLIPSEKEKIFAKNSDELLNKIKNYLFFVRDRDILNALNTLTDIQKNLIDIGFLVTIMRLNYSRIEKSQRKLFLKDLIKFINNWKSAQEND